jgi:hypothetical protein
MDKRELKAIIVDLKERNCSFQTISDILARDYNIQMSRQAVCGMYQRATSDEAIKKNTDIILTACDICKYASLGLSSKQIKSIMTNAGYSLSMSDIEYILEINKQYIEKMDSELVSKIIKSITKGSEAAEIKQTLSHNGVTITDSKFRNLMIEATKQMLNKEVASVLYKVYTSTDDKGLIKDILSDINSDMTIKDIENSNNERQSNSGCFIRVDGRNYNVYRPKQTIDMPVKVEMQIIEEA